MIYFPSVPTMILFSLRQKRTQVNVEVSYPGNQLTECTFLLTFIALEKAKTE